MDEWQDYWLRMESRSSILERECLQNIHQLAEWAVENTRGDVVTCSPGNATSALVIGNAIRAKCPKYWFYDTRNNFNYYIPDSDYGAYVYSKLHSCDPDKMVDLFNSLNLGLPIFSSVLNSFNMEIEIPKSISFLHINASLNVLVKRCLDLFYDNVEEGGIIVLDDFGWWEGSRRAFYSFCFSHGEYPLLERCGCSQVYWIKGRTHNRISGYKIL